MALVAILAAPAAQADPCCLNLQCVDLTPTACANQSGGVGFCVIGSPCSAPTCNTGGIAPITNVKAAKIPAVGPDITMTWDVENDADRYELYYVTAKTGMWDPLESTCRHASLSIL